MRGNKSPNTKKWKLCDRHFKFAVYHLCTVLYCTYPDDPLDRLPFIPPSGDAPPSFYDMGNALNTLIAQATPSSGAGDEEEEEEEESILLTEEHGLLLTCCWVTLKVASIRFRPHNSNWLAAMSLSEM